jgi:poly(3-hydroxybutyrate) depolymerase
MWWKDYMVKIIGIITQCFSILDMINQNKVFISGYSAGGDGIYHLAGMMADSLAGAAMMAGHPNNAEICNLRNITFSIQVGG